MQTVNTSVLKKLHLGPHSGSSRMAQLARWAPGIALVLLLIIGFIASPIFITTDNIQAVLLASAILIILSIGQTFAISTAGIDLSVGSTVALAGVVMGAVIDRGGGTPLAIILALLAGALVGVINGMVIARGKISDFIVTLGSFSVLSGLGLLISDAKPVVVNSNFFTALATSGIGPLSYLVCAALVVALLGRVLMFNTAFGTHVLAVGGNKSAAIAMGLRFSRVKIAVYAISGFCAAIGGVLLVARLGAAEPTAGTEYQLTSIAAAVLGGVSLFGGKSNIIGPLLGAIILTGILNLLTITSVPVYYQPIAVGAVVVLSAVLRRFEAP